MTVEKVMELYRSYTKGLLVKILSSYYRDKPVIIQTLTFTGTFTAKIVQGTSDKPEIKVITGFINPIGFTVEIQAENYEYLDSNIILRVKGVKVRVR